MKYLLIFIRAVFYTLICCLWYFIVFICKFLWSFHITKYSEVITNNGKEYKTVILGAEAITKVYSVPLEFNNNPFETFKNYLK